MLTTKHFTKRLASGLLAKSKLQRLIELSQEHSATLPEQEPTVFQPALNEQVFTNEPVNPNIQLIDTLDFTQLSPKYRRMNILTTVLFWGAALAILALVFSGLFFDISDKHYPIAYALAGVIVFLATWSVIYHYFADPLKQYVVREHDINYQSGWLFKSLVSQPILRIQHVELKRGPIERKYNLATLQVFSAGGASYTFNIPGLEHDDAIKLRQFVLDHKDLAADE